MESIGVIAWGLVIGVNASTSNKLKKKNMNHNPNAEKLRQLLFIRVKEITLKGGISLYYDILNEIERCDINDEEELEKRLLRK